MPQGIAFEPSFTGSVQEREWIVESLGVMYYDHWISDVVARVRGGKEATVYCCRAHPTTGRDLIAAKVYRPRMFRAMRNDALYREGRDLLGGDGKPMRDRRSRLAVRKKTGYGKRLATTSWVQHEYQSMCAFHRAGADIVEPLAVGDNAILMEYVGSEGMGAPVLDRVRLTPDEVRPLFERLMHNIELFLACDRIHADLSAYNVLYWEGDVRIIDFPQTVDAFTNPSAVALLGRDVMRICQHFGRYGVESDAAAIATGLWSRFLRREL